MQQQLAKLWWSKLGKCFVSFPALTKCGKEEKGKGREEQWKGYTVIIFFQRASWLSQVPGYVCFRCEHLPLGWSSACCSNSSLADVCSHLRSQPDWVLPITHVVTHSLLFLFNFPLACPLYPSFLSLSSSALKKNDWHVWYEVHYL